MTLSLQTPVLTETAPSAASPAQLPASQPSSPKSNHIHYPESDGQPMADNTKQFHYIVSIKSGFDALYKDNPNVFVAGDLLWYPVEGNNKLRQAPDVMLAYGRPKGDRGSYLQWLEGGISPQVVFEILSPGNRMTEMEKKWRFYEQYGVEEYYQYDPDRGDLVGWLRREGRFEVIEEMEGWVSPRAGVRFSLEDGELVLHQSDGQRFLTYLGLLEQMEAERQRAEAERQRAEAERQRAETERQRAERLATRLRELGVDPDLL
ncbi:MAG: Uma2 family endonuclease [Caldilineaceae bacterium]